MILIVLLLAAKSENAIINDSNPPHCLVIIGSEKRNLSAYGCIYVI